MRGKCATGGARGTIGPTLLLLLAAGAHAAPQHSGTSIPLDTTGESALTNADPSLVLEQSTAAKQGIGIRSADFTGAGYDTTESDFRLGLELEDELRSLNDAKEEGLEGVRRSGLIIPEYLTPEGYSLASDTAPLSRASGGKGVTYYLRKVIPSNELVFLDSIYGAENLITCTRDGEFHRVQTPWKQCLVCVCVQGGRPACTSCGECATGAAPMQLSPLASAALSTALLDSLLPYSTVAPLALPTAPELPIPLQPVPVKPITPLSLQPILEFQPFQTFPLLQLQQPLMPQQSPNQPQPMLILPPPQPPEEISDLSVGDETSCAPLPTGVAFEHPLNPCQSCLCQAPADGQSDVKISCIESNQCENPIFIPELVETPLIPKPIQTPHCQKFPKNVIFPHPTDRCRECQCFAPVSAFASAEPQILCIPISDCKIPTADLLQPSLAIQQDQHPSLPLSVPPEHLLSIDAMPSESRPIIPLFMESIPAESILTLPLASLPEPSVPYLKPSLLSVIPETAPSISQTNIIGQFPAIKNIPALPIRPYQGLTEPLFITKTVPPPTLSDLLANHLTSTQNPSILEIPLRPAIAVEPPQGLLTLKEKLSIKVKESPNLVPLQPPEESLNPDYLTLFPELNSTGNVEEPVTGEPLPWPPIIVPSLPKPVKGPLPGPPPHKSCLPYPPNTAFQHPWDECQLCRCSEFHELGYTTVEVNCFTKPSCCIELPVLQAPITGANSNKIAYTEPRCQARPLNLPFVLGCEVCVCHLLYTSIYARCSPQPKCAGRLANNGETPVSATLAIPVNGALHAPVPGAQLGLQSQSGLQGQQSLLSQSHLPNRQDLQTGQFAAAFHTGQVTQKFPNNIYDYAPISFTSPPNRLTQYSQNSPVIPINNFVSNRKPLTRQQPILSSLINYQQFPLSQKPQLSLKPSESLQQNISTKLLNLLKGVKNNYVQSSTSSPYNMNGLANKYGNQNLLWSNNHPPNAPNSAVEHAVAEAQWSNNYVPSPPSPPNSALSQAVAEASLNSLYFRGSNDFATTVRPSLRQHEYMIHGETSTEKKSEEDDRNAYKLHGTESALALIRMPTGQTTWDTTTRSYADLNKKALADELAAGGGGAPVTRGGRGLCQFAGDMYHARCQACRCLAGRDQDLYSMCFGNPCQ